MPAGFPEVIYPNPLDPIRVRNLLKHESMMSEEAVEWAREVNELGSFPAEDICLENLSFEKVLLLLLLFKQYKQTVSPIYKTHLTEKNFFHFFKYIHQGTATYIAALNSFLPTTKLGFVITGNTFRAPQEVPLVQTSCEAEDLVDLEPGTVIAALPTFRARRSGTTFWLGEVRSFNPGAMEYEVLWFSPTMSKSNEITWEYTEEGTSYGFVPLQAILAVDVRFTENKTISNLSQAQIDAAIIM